MGKNGFILEEHSCCKLFRTTKYYLYFSLLQLVLSLCLIATLFLSDKEKVFPMEVIVCLLLLGDIIIRFFSDGQFIDKTSNKIDLVLLVLVLALVCLQWIGGSVYEPISQLGYSVFVVRYGFQLYRIFTLVKQSRELRQLQQMGEITMDDIDLSEDFGNYQLHKENKTKI